MRRGGLFEAPAAGGPPKRRSSGRIRQWTDRMKVVDDDTRAEVNAKRLKALNSDNFADDDIPVESTDGEWRAIDPDVDDDGDAPERPAKRRKMNVRPKDPKKRFRERAPKSLQQAIEQDRLDVLPSDVPTYLTIDAPPSQYPPRHFCYVCGNESAYTCPRCGLRFCKLKCDETHRESRCLKFIQ